MESHFFMSMRRLAFAIHELTSWGGHDRSTLEIARRLSHRFPVDLFTYTLQDPVGRQAWGDVRLLPVWPYVRRPAAWMISYFYLISLLRFGLRSRRSLIHATGACSLVSDVVQVQFVNAAWKKAQRELAQGAKHSGAFSPKSWLKNAYHRSLFQYDLAVERFVYRPEKTYIAISHSVARELREFYGLRERVHVIHHGVDLQVFCPVNESSRSERERLREDLGIGPEEKVFLFVGTFERKGLAQAIDALGGLEPALQKNVRLLAVGSGAVDAFRARARACGIEDRVIFVPHTRTVAPYYRASDFFVLPTLYEPFGLVILEAMACGLPPIVSRLAGAAELIQHNESGILLENPQNSREITEAMTHLLRGPVFAQKLSKGACAVAQGRSWDRVAEEYATVLGPLLLK